MRSKYVGDFGRSHLLRLQADQAVAYFQNQFGDSVKTVGAEWDLGIQGKHTVIALTLRDTVSGKTEQCKFTPKDMESPSVMHAQVYNALGKIK